MKAKFMHLLYILLFLCLAVEVTAKEYPLTDQQQLIGEQKTVHAADADDTLLDIARRHGLGYQDITLANPDTDTWLPGQGTAVTLPMRFVMPHGKRQGIVINIPERRLYYYPNDPAKQSVQIYAIGIGRQGWNTPYVETTIVGKQKKPNWYPPDSIRKEAAETGESCRKWSNPDRKIHWVTMPCGLV